MISHLFRHQHGRMASILTRVFGLSNLELIEDAIQDTFIKAMLSWRTQIPENPEAWLTQAAKNRAIDLLRKVKAERERKDLLESGPASIAFQELFLENEIEDSQLRMIFTACHPALNPRDQIAFALKTIAGFSAKEIASSLLLKEETIKKRLSRARKSVQEQAIKFEIPMGEELPLRLKRVLEVLYLIFNEGFHSNRKDKLIREELCGEALRLCQFLLKKEALRTGQLYALFALMCFHASRLESKINEQHEIIDLKNQDRKKWHFPLIEMGNMAMNKAVEDRTFSAYHYEAAIASEHLRAASFEETNWEKILMWYEQLCGIQATPFTFLNKAIVLMQLGRFKEAKEILDLMNQTGLEQRTYLYYATLAEYFDQTEQVKEALKSIDLAIEMVNNSSEKEHLLKKKLLLEARGNLKE